MDDSKSSRKLITTPVIYIVFNRPDCVRKSFERIRQVRPRKLFIVADGPREDHPEDLVLCEECRRITEEIDWDCDVKRDYAEKNLGCGVRPASGITNAFQEVEEAIILEDDCIPEESFFFFCQEMLDKYRDDERILSVSGLNYGFRSQNDADYYFVHFNNTWGWATWRRVWRFFDYQILAYPEYKDSGELKTLLMSDAYVDYWYHLFDEVYGKEIRSVWDTQFMFMSFLHKGLHIYPRESMVRCIGFGEQSTHFQQYDHKNRLFSGVQNVEEIHFPLSHPAFVMEDFRIDCLMMEEIYNVSMNKRKRISSLPATVRGAIQSAENLIIYGAGAVCRELICYLNTEGIDRFQIAVTKLSPGEKKYVMGNEVYEISHFERCAKDVTVLIAATERYAGEMVETLKKLGFQNYFCVLGES